MVLKDGDGGIGHVTGDDGGFSSRQRRPFVGPDFFTDLRRALRRRRFADSSMARLAGATLLTLLAVGALYVLVLALR
jgi:hypothetical protein